MKRIHVIIPAAGEAKRIRLLSDSLSKALIPVNGKPIISWIFDELKEIPKAGSPTGDYITREEFEAVINSLRSAPVGQPAPAPVF